MHSSWDPEHLKLSLTHQWRIFFLSIHNHKSISMYSVHKTDNVRNFCLISHQWDVTISLSWKMFYSKPDHCPKINHDCFLSHHYSPTISNQEGYSFHLMLHDLNAVCICKVNWTCFTHVLCKCARQDNYLPNINNSTSGISTWHFPCLIADLWLKCEIVLGALSRGSTKHRRHREHIIVVIFVVNTASREV